MTTNVLGVTPLLEVFDMPTSMAFYCDALGFEVVQSYPAGDRPYWVMLQLGGSTLMLNTAYDEGERPALPEPGRVKGHVDTVLYFDCASVDNMYAYLSGKRCDVKEPEATFFGMRQIWLKDPDGFQICFQSPLEP